MVLIIDYEKPRKTLGRKVILPKYPEATFFIHKYKGEYRLSEARSGSMVIQGDKGNKELILKAQARFDSVIPQRYKNITEKAEQWTNRNISDDCNTLGGGIAIEPRYFEDIYEGIKDAGLTLKSV